MKRITLLKKDFPAGQQGSRHLSFTKQALLRAVITAGQKPSKRRRTVAAQADIDMRISALISALDMSGNSLVPTPEFLAAGRTDKSQKSYFVGNALCSHAAYVELKIPWLVDIERLDSTYKIKKASADDRRPDFLGRSPASRWYVFESQGRSGPPTKPNLKDWKLQASAISGVNGRPVTHNIVSAAYIRRSREWEILWVDPPGDPEALEIDDTDFFESYYAPVLELVDRGGPLLELPGGALRYVEALDAYVGIRRDVLSALRLGNVAGIMAFAGDRIGTGVEDRDDQGVATFADGLMILLGREFDNRGFTAVPECHQSSKNVVF